MLEGVIPILATPFTDAGAVDTASLARIAESALREGATGLGALGIASETFALLPEERQLVLKTIRQVAGDHIPLIVGVDATSTTTARDQAARAMDTGADVVMILAPFLVKPTRQGLVDFYGDLGRDFQSVMVQDSPGNTGVEMDVDLILDLARLDGVRYFKIESSDSPTKMGELSERCPSLRLLGGRNGVVMVDELAAGAIGTMPACEFTRELVGIFQLALDDLGAGSARHATIAPLLLFGVRPRKGWAVHKYILKRRGLIMSDATRAPAERLTAAETAELEALLVQWDDLSGRGGSSEQ